MIRIMNFQADYLAAVHIFRPSRDQAAAKNIRFLKRFNITHVLNAAEGPWPEHCVNLSPEYYEGSGITYLVRTQLNK